MKKNVSAVACAAFLALSAVPAMAAPKHSLTQYAYLVGKWNCIAHFAGRKPLRYSTAFAWLFPNHSAIDQTFSGMGGQAHFMLTYNKWDDDFRGVFVDSTGSVGTWTNPGPANGAWTELGYDLDANGYPENSVAHFMKVTPTHYAFAFRYKSRSGAWSTENDSCDKVAS